jgi:hypothetical protein
MKIEQTRTAPSWVPHLAAVLAGLPVLVWASMLLFAGLSWLASAVSGPSVGTGMLVLVTISSLAGGLLAAVVTGRWVRARLAQMSLLMALLWLLLIVVVLSVAPAPFVHVLE